MIRLHNRCLCIRHRAFLYTGAPKSTNSTLCSGSNWGQLLGPEMVGWSPTWSVWLTWRERGRRSWQRGIRRTGAMKSAWESCVARCLGWKREILQPPSCPRRGGWAWLARPGTQSGTLLSTWSTPGYCPEMTPDLKGRHRQARRGEGGKMEQQINQHLPAPDFLPHLPSLIPSTPHQRNPNLNSKLRLRSAIRKTNSVFCVKLCGLFSLHQPLYIIHTSHGWGYT